MQEAAAAAAASFGAVNAYHWKTHDKERNNTKVALNVLSTDDSEDLMKLPDIMAPTPKRKGTIARLMKLQEDKRNKLSALKAQKLRKIEKRQKELEEQLELERQRQEANQVFNKRDAKSAKIAKRAARAMANIDQSLLHGTMLWKCRIEGCKEEFRSSTEQEQHEQWTCPFRRIQCKYKGCGMTYLANCQRAHRRVCVFRPKVEFHHAHGADWDTVPSRRRRNRATGKHIFLKSNGMRRTLPEEEEEQKLTLPPDRRRQLCELFALLDHDNKGHLDVHKIRKLNRIKHGFDSTLTLARRQIERADTDKDGRLSLQEFLDFSTPLAALPDSLFTQMMAVAMDNCGVSSSTDSRFAIH